MFSDRVHNSVLVLWLWAKRQQQQQRSAACGVTLCPAVAVVAYKILSFIIRDELSKEKNAEKALSLWTAVPHLRWYSNISRGHYSWMDRRDPLVGDPWLIPGSVSSFYLHAFHVCPAGLQLRVESHCAASVLQPLPQSVPCLLTRSQPNTKWLTKAIHLCPNENF